MNETLTRTLSGAVYILVLVGCALFPVSFTILFGIFLLIAVSEFCELVNLPKTFPIVISAVLYVLFATWPLSDITQSSLLGLTLFVSVSLLFFLFSQRPPRLDRLSKYVFLIGYVVLPIVFITKLPSVNGVFRPEIIISVFVLIWANDTFAFLIGKGFGKHKLLERVSPKKTIEGFIGGWIFALLFAIPISIWLTKEPLAFWLVIATIASYLGTLGDLVESKFKRMAGVKDSGRIMPGHGGILDRLDSIIFVTPFVFLFYQIVHYVS
ncbi:phosphatidate cytidylyltransferase [Flavobacterium sp. MAH-1]|uniref:Phosphatidate cytidylyltransferase n=1 Tax=Flavobacterium agri TaxID=2743471 RepID=A0A7Y9C691_9FLAO|nr:phosphatidate cytidylyltransferase [Flavobacterium agri]NUY82127.1 phosphatidate cytidylyltransferase [Flavobacterium agri]NYA72151.1 phosphatidate cytidylyltransferase [Flavobacterium agri]